MTRIIDYAGLYPPASLPLEQAFRNFLEYQTDRDAWMLSRFVIPAKRLAELNLRPDSTPLAYTTLGRGDSSAGEFLANLEMDLADIKAFRAAHPTQTVDMFETALPAAALGDLSAAHDLVNPSSDLLNQNGLYVFFEAPFGEGWQARAEVLMRALRKLKDRHVGLKLRTGGVTADAFPSTEQVAWAIAFARDAGVPLKCTAGLHHPVRHYNQSVQTKMHGFLNVFGAGVLAVARNLSQGEIQAILDDEDESHFVFNEDGFAWNNLRVVTKEEIAKLRHQIISFGSCSFDEPKEDLQKMGLL